VREFHGVRRAAAGHAAQLTDITEHFGQRYGGHHGDVRAVLQLVLNQAATAWLLRCARFNGIWLFANSRPADRLPAVVTEFQ